MVNWKEIPKIDAHIHLLPDDVISANIGYGDPFVDYGSVDDYLNVMKAYNIERACIMPLNDPCMLSMDFTVETVHSNLHKMVTSTPSKFWCFADIDIRKNICHTLMELETAVREKEFIGIKIHPSNAGYPIDGEYYDQIFKYANDQDVLVEIHSYPREQLSDDVCSPSRIKRILDKYPGLRLSIAHLGGFQCEEFIGVNAYFNISAILPDMVGRLGIEQTNRLLRAIGVEKLVFATDYPDSRSLKPNEIYEQYFDMLGKMDFTEEEALRICKYNALEMTRGR